MTRGSSGNNLPEGEEAANITIPSETEEDKDLESVQEGMQSDKEPRERGYPNSADASIIGAQAEGINTDSDARAPGASSDGRGGTGTSNAGFTVPTTMEPQVNRDPSGSLFIQLGFTMEEAHCFVSDEMMTGTDTICHIYDNIVEHLVNVYRKPGGGGCGMPVSKISEWNFKLLVYLIKQEDKIFRTLDMNGIHPTHISDIEDHHTLDMTNDNSLVTALVITKLLIDKNIYVMWNLIH